MNTKDLFLKGEVWRDIKNYEGYYQVSNFGRVKSLKRSRVKNDKIIKSSLNKTGYLSLMLCKDGEDSTKRTHRLVAEAFIPNPENKPYINHINGIKDDNRVENLEWCTQQENVIHSYKNGFQTGKKGESCHWTKLKESDIHEIVNLINKGLMSKEIAKLYNTSEANICDIKNGRNWSSITGISPIERSKRILKDHNIPDILSLIKQGYSNTKIGHMFGVSHKIISLIKLNKTYTHISRI